MRRLATTIALVTSSGDGWTGTAATAVMSVCVEPPTLLNAVNRTTSIHPVLMTESHFCVNLLADRHQELAGTFSGKKKGLERCETGGWIAHDGGIPLLDDALASLVSRTTQPDWIIILRSTKTNLMAFLFRPTVERLER